MMDRGDAHLVFYGEVDRIIRLLNMGDSVVVIVENP